MQSLGETNQQTDMPAQMIIYLKNKFFDFLLDILSDLKLIREFLQSDKKDLVDCQLVLTAQKIWDFLSLF